MDNQNNGFCKTLEVIWNRNKSTHRSKLLPEFKMINIDDSVEKVKMSKLDKFAHTIKINENEIEFPNKRVKRSLFQENKKEVSKYSTVNKLNIKHCENHNFANYFTNSTETSQMSLTKSPPILLNREKIKGNKSKQHLFQTECPKTADSLPAHSVIDASTSSCIVNEKRPNTKPLLYAKSPEITSNRKRWLTDDKLIQKINSTESNCCGSTKLNKKHCETQNNATYSDNLTKTSQIPLIGSSHILSIRTESPKTAECLPTRSLDDTSFIKSSCIVNQKCPSTNNLFYTKSPEIISNQERHFTDHTFLEQMISDEPKCFDSNLKSNKKYFEAQKDATYSNNLIETSQISSIKSPPILSKREKIKMNKSKQHLFPIGSIKITERSPPRSVNDTSVIKSSCIVNQLRSCSRNSLYTKSPEIMSNRKRRFTDDKLLKKINSDESKCSESNKLNEKYCGAQNNAIYCNSSTVTSQISLIKSPPLLSNQEKLKRNKSKRCLFQIDSTKNAKRSPPHSVNDISIIKSSCIVNQKRLSTKKLLYTKSPEIMSNRKRRFTEKMNSDESICSESNKLNKKYCETQNDATNFNNLTETPQISLTRSPQILSNREKLKFNISKQFQVESSKTANYLPQHSDLSLNTRNLLYTKSPEIMSNRKRQFIEDKLSEKINVSSDTINKNYNFIPQNSKELIEKSEHLITNRSKVRMKLNFEDIGDVIESSETMHLADKKKLKENIISGRKKNKTNNCISRSVKHELNSAIDRKNEVVLQNNALITEIITKNELCDDINDSLDIINTENILISPKIKLKNSQRKSKIALMESKKYIKHLVPPSMHSKELVETVEIDLKTLQFQRIDQDKDKSISTTHLSSEISVIPATPEHNVVIEDESEIKCSSKTVLNSYIPQIEVDKSPKTPLSKKHHLVIQSVSTPPNTDGSKLPVLFESVVSPTQSFINSELSFKIDSVESPSTAYDCDKVYSSEMIQKRLDKSSSPNCFDSAKKRKKVCKDGLRGKFRELINRKKSEACIREYEKNLSTNHQPKHVESTLLNIIEVWKTYRTYVLLCYHMKSETQVQKVMVTLDNCPRNATKNSVIRIYSPFLTIDSKITEIVLFVGVIHAEVIDDSGPNRPLGFPGLFTNISGLPTTIFQSEVQWKCNCSEEAACQCLGESSVYNYLQYMIS